MSPLGLFLIVIIIALPVAWMVSEFRCNRSLRITSGVLALGGVTVSVWALSTVTTRFNYNAWYGHATGELIGTSIHEIENGHFDHVLKVWRGLHRQYHPTYENRAGYQKLVEEATSLMRRDSSIDPGTAWDASEFERGTWVGHWENEHGYWLVVNDGDDPFDIIRSGDPLTKMHSVFASPDFAVLKFKEGDKWSHTLTLQNKYEAVQEWFDGKGTVWKTETMHKLVRATSEQKGTTQQSSPEIPSETGR